VRTLSASLIFLAVIRVSIDFEETHPQRDSEQPVGGIFVIMIESLPFVSNLPPSMVGVRISAWAEVNASMVETMA